MLRGRKNKGFTELHGEHSICIAATKNCNIGLASWTPAINKKVSMTDKGKQANSKQLTGTNPPDKAHNLIHSSLVELIESGWHHELR